MRLTGLGMHRTHMTVLLEDEIDLDIGVKSTNMQGTVICLLHDTSAGYHMLEWSG